MSSARTPRVLRLDLPATPGETVIKYGVDIGKVVTSASASAGSQRRRRA